MLGREAEVDWSKGAPENERGSAGRPGPIMIYGPKTDRILAGVLTVASGGWLILILLGHLEPLGWGQVLGLFVLFLIGVASLITQMWFRRLG
jgi:hypothetical protein